MSKYIELIDKYRIEQSSDADYNPPSYILTDNTGELVRCENCEHWNEGHVDIDCPWDVLYSAQPDAYDYCSKGERKKDE